MSNASAAVLLFRSGDEKTSGYAAVKRRNRSICDSVADTADFSQLMPLPEPDKGFQKAHSKPRDEKLGLP